MQRLRRGLRRLTEMQSLACTPPRTPRLGAMAAVAAIHVVVVAALLALPQVRERLREPEPLYVRFHANPAPDAPASPARPIAPAMLQHAPRIVVEIPAFTMVAEAVPAIAPAAVTSSAAAEPSSGPSPAQAAPALVPPRFDMAYLRNPAPAYPSVSRRLKEQGRVLLNVLVAASGEAQSIEVRASSGFDRLDRAAVDAVRHWRFVPAQRGPEAVAGWAIVPILFELPA